MSKLVKIPGMVDPHTHLRDLTWAHKATFASETAAAVAGGYWAVFDMPNTPPSTISREALDHKLDAVGASAVCDWGVYFGAAQTNADEAVTSAVVDDVCGLKVYCNATTGDLMIGDQALREAHYRVWPADKIIAVHAEGETVLDVLDLVRRYRKRTHFCHISTAYEVAALEAARNEGLPVTIGVCPHHLYLTEADVPALSGFGLMKPELKTDADRSALWRALGRGVIDVIESDHAPHTIAEKESPTPPFGVPGLETTLPLMLLAVFDGCVTFDQVVALLSENPRRIWGLTLPEDTYALIDLDAPYTIDRQHLHTQCGWSPFEGMRVPGRVVETWIRGRKVYDGEQVMAQAGSGRSLFGAEAT